MNNHLYFLLVEIKATFFERTYFSRKGFKYIRRFFMRYLSNYFDSFRYYLNRNKINLKINSLKEDQLIKNGYKILSDINLNDLSFLKINKNENKDIASNANTIVSMSDAENFARIRSFNAIAKEYLKEQKCNFFVHSWNTKVFYDPDKVKTTQWHRDRDGYKVLKFFIYLTDVDDDSGPHEYAIKSHLIKPFRFTPQIRYKDFEVKNYFDVVKINGKAGTCFVADTTGLHKGTAPIKNGRSIIVFNYYTGSIIWDQENLLINL